MVNVWAGHAEVVQLSDNGFETGWFFGNLTAAARQTGRQSPPSLLHDACDAESVDCNRKSLAVRGESFSAIGQDVMTKYGSPDLIHPPTALLDWWLPVLLSVMQGAMRFALCPGIAKPSGLRPSRILHSHIAGADIGPWNCVKRQDVQQVSVK